MFSKIILHIVEY